MHVNPSASDLKSISFDENIWGMVLGSSYSLILDLRDEVERKIRLVELDLLGFRCLELEMEISWWERLVAFEGGYLYTIQYPDQNNPSSHSIRRVELISGESSGVESLPSLVDQVVEPSLYEHGTGYHNTVAGFLSLDLPLSCEYLEWNGKIIISYYLRSDKGFDRYLLLLDGEKKIWKIRQDRGMKGFSPGAFFISNDQLIFIKDRNEVCCYPL